MSIVYVPPQMANTLPLALYLSQIVSNLLTLYIVLYDFALVVARGSTYWRYQKELVSYE